MQNLYNYDNLETYNLSLPNNLPNVSHILYPKQVKYENIDIYDSIIEYLIIPYGAYVDSGYVPNNETGMMYECIRTATTDTYYMGLRETSGNTRFAVNMYSTVAIGWGSYYPLSGSFTYSQKTKVEINMYNSRVGGVGTNTKSIPTLPFTPTLTIYVGGANVGYSSSVGKPPQHYFYGAQITQESELIMDFIPVRVGQIGYMYDKISHKLFGNSGTGDFILGPDIYITDGLIFWLDGINKGSNDNSWTDLIGGIVFTGTDVTSTEYGWSFNGSTSYFLSDSVLTGTADYTVEVCFKPNNTNTYCLFMCNKNTQNNVLFYKNGNNITFSQYNNTYPLTLSANQKCSVSLNLDNGLLNGSPVSKNSGTDYWSGTNNFYIGRRSAGAYFSGEIYSIRIYNRKLSQSEQLTNFNIDNNRFNLGL